MNKFNFKKGAKALVIVAHPDDETIWMGGTILKHKKIDWTIFSLCRASDKDRAPKFFRVCKYFGACGIMTDLEDEGKLNIKQSIPLIKKLVIDKVKAKKFDYIFTHGLNGEYGHERHTAVHLAVEKLIQEKKIKPEAVFYFNYKKISKYKLAPKKDSDLVIKLTRQEFKKKVGAMAEIYGFDPKGIDAGYCTKEEAFKRVTRNI